MIKRKTLRGITFVEMIVTVVIFSMVMLGASIFFVRMWDTNAFTIETGLASFIASRGVDRAVQDIRKARPAENGTFTIVQADDHDFTFFADYDGDGIVERVHYFVSDERFQVGVTEPNMTNLPPTYPSGDQIIEDAADYIVNESMGNPTFEYFSDTGKIYSYADVAGTVLSTPATPSDVKMVKILLFVNPDPIRKPNNVRIQSFAVVRNLTEFDELPT